MICAKCGKENEEGVSVCAQCGAGMVGGGEPVQAREGRGMELVYRIVRIAVVVTLVLTVAMAVSYWGGVWQATAERRACLTNIKRLGIAVTMYVSDWDERFPPAQDWCGAITIYTDPSRWDMEPWRSHIKHMEEPIELDFVCPSARDRECGYAFNRALSLRRLAETGVPAEVVMLFESDLGWNGAGGLGDLPAEPRHRGGDCFAFVDGHAKWIARGDQSGLGWRPE